MNPVQIELSGTLAVEPKTGSQLPNGYWPRDQDFFDISAFLSAYLSGCDL